MADRDGQPLVRDAHVDPWLDETGKPRPFPTTHEEREKNPSDHLTYSMTLGLRDTLKKAGIDPQSLLAGPEASGPGWSAFEIGRRFSPDGKAYPFGLEDLKTDGFDPAAPNPLARITLADNTGTVGLKNFGKRLQLQKSRFLAKELIDRDHLIVLRSDSPPLELIPDYGFTFTELAVDGDGFRATLKPLAGDGASKVFRFDGRGKPRSGF